MKDEHAMVADESPEATDWISLAEATRLVPSCQAGKKVRRETIWRWALKYNWDTLLLHGYRYVRRRDVLSLFPPPEND
jgi:hypothetical protein